MIRIGLTIGLLCLALSAPLRAEPAAAVGPTSGAPRLQTAAEAAVKSPGCITCHAKSDAPTMHRNKAVMLGCADCHGGNPNVTRPEGTNITFRPSKSDSPAA